MDQQAHNISLRIGGKVVEKWESYEVTNDLLQPADGFRMSLPNADLEVFNLCQPDEEVQVLLDGTIVLTGYIDDRGFRCTAAGGTALEIAGRDKGGRLMDESAPLTAYAGLGIKQLAEKMVLDWFPAVALSNAENRRLLRGRGAPQAKVSSEPAIITPPHPERKVNPGESRWQVLARFLEQAHVLGWSTADGKQFVVGLPNYAQEAQYRFFVPASASARRAEGNVIDLDVTDSVGERYSLIVACGSSKGKAAKASGNYSSRVTRRRGEARDNVDDAFGVGLDFRRRKVLLVADDDVKNDDLAQDRADREMAVRNGSGRRVTLSVRGHAQVREGGRPALYAPDSMAHLEVEAIGLVGRFLVTAVRFQHSARAGEITELTLVPDGTVLSL